MRLQRVRHKLVTKQQQQQIQFARHRSSQQLVKHKRTFPSGLESCWWGYLIRQNSKRRILLYQKWKAVSLWLLFLEAQWTGLAIILERRCGSWGGRKRLVGTSESPMWPLWHRHGFPLAQITSFCILYSVELGRKDTGNHICFYLLIILNTKANTFWAPTDCGLNSPSQCASETPFSGAAILLPLHIQKGKGVIIPQEHLNCSN